MHNSTTTQAPTPLHNLLDHQRQTFLHAGPPTLEQRLAKLQALRTAILSLRTDIETALNTDFGHRSHHETAIMELAPVISGIDYLRKHLRRFMQPSQRKVDLSLRLGRARVEYQPLGVIGIICPWNYPVQLALMPLATALAAGNRALLKLSEFTPATNAVLIRLLAGVFAQDEVAVVTGDADTAAAFSALPFDHLFFTGSTAVGRKVMQAASQHLVPVTLELGGKSPVMVASGHAMAQAAAHIAYGKLANAGQTCIAPDYALVHEDDIEGFVAAFDRAVRKLYPAGPTSRDYSSIINEHHHARILALIADAQDKGAQLRLLGASPEQAAQRPNTLAPALLLKVSDDMRIMQEEIFGPILPVVSYRSLDEAIAYVNARPRPLALYYFGPQGAERDRVLTRTTSGGVTINGTLLHIAQDDLPFGGVGASGMGAYHGIEGFRTMSHAKGVFEQGRCNAATLLRPPFGTLANKVLHWVLLRR